MMIYVDICGYNVRVFNGVYLPHGRVDWACTNKKFKQVQEIQMFHHVYSTLKHVSARSGKPNFPSSLDWRLDRPGLGSANERSSIPAPFDLIVGLPPPLNHEYILIYRSIYAIEPTVSGAMFTNFPTSSTAQGGGGSFKNMKPIGELGCCESGMAERSH